MSDQQAERRAVGDDTPRLPTAPRGTERAEHFAFAQRLVMRLERGRSATIFTRPDIEAGWITLRLVEAWIAQPAQPAPLFRRCAVVQRVVDALPTGPVRRALTRLVRHVRGEQPHGHSVTEALFGYGQVLEDGEEWMLAADVYEMVCDYATRLDEFDVSRPAYERFTVCTRRLRKLWCAAQATQRRTRRHGRTDRSPDHAAAARHRDGAAHPSSHIAPPGAD